MLNALIAYYSETGNTKKLAGVIKDFLALKGYSSDVDEIKTISGPNSFFTKILWALFWSLPAIEREILDVSRYDMILIGTPIWASNPTPQIRSYVRNSNGWKNKKVVAFFTCGSGLGKKHAMNEVKKMLLEKSVSEISYIAIPQNDMDDRVLLDGEIKKVLG